MDINNTFLSTPLLSIRKPTPMAVQAQNLLSELASIPDLCARNGAPPIDLDEQQRQMRLLLGSQTNLGFPPMFGRAVFSTGQQNSELTCNRTTPSRKRGRDDDSTHHQSYSTVRKLRDQIAAADCLYDGRAENSAMASTSGTSAVSMDAPRGSADRNDLISCLYHQSLEVDAFVRLHGERLRSQLQEVSRRHCQALLSAVERQIERRLAEKESELQRAKRRNAELEEKLTQVSTENQVWFNVARNNEAVVANLRSTLEHALVQQQQNAPAEEGFGESADGNDEASCCFDDNHRLGDGGEREPVQSPSCRGCGERGDACVLLLPCRHLCLCKSCESKIDTCPVCHTPRNASIQVFTMS